MKKAVVLLSGGLDSTTCLAYATANNNQCFALSFDYGQKHRSELLASQRIAKQFNVAQHEIVTLSTGNLSNSALTDANIKIPEYAGGDEIPVTYVPARNTTFLAIALGWAEVLDASSIFIGCSAVDYSGYPDCRPEYMAAFQRMANLATKAGVEGNPIEIKTPLIHLSKAETIQLGISLGVDYSETISCYQASPEGLACGQCDSCYLRKQGFAQAGVDDPTKYSPTT